MQQEAIEVGKLYGDCGDAAERRGMQHNLVTFLARLLLTFGSFSPRGHGKVQH